MVEFSRRSTAADIAKSAGVAKSTVSLAFSAPERVSTKTRDRILSAAKAAGYTPNPVAQSLKTGRNNIVGLILADLTNPHGGSVLEQVQKTANEIGYMVMTATAAHDPKRDIEFVRKFEQLNVRAAIIMPSGSDEKYVSALKDSSIRFVTYGHKLSGLELGWITAWGWNYWSAIWWNLAIAASGISRVTSVNGVALKDLMDCDKV